MSNDGVAHSSPLPFLFHARATITHLSPARALSSGGARVTLAGASLDTLPDPHCDFGGKLVRGELVGGSRDPGEYLPAGIGGGPVVGLALGGGPVRSRGGSQVVCVAPASAAGEVVVSVGDVRTGVWAASSVPFTYIPDPEVVALEPSTGPASGGTVVTVSGSNFSPGLVTCLIGPALAFRGEYRSPRSVLCFIPPRLLLPTGKFPLEVSVGGISVAFSSDGVLYNLHAPLNPLLLEPSAGSERGGDLITVLGTKFESALHCRFGSNGALIPASHLSASAVTCTAPAASPGNVSVSISSNAQDFATCRASFTYLPALRPHTLFPTSAAATGGAKVTVSGAGFAGHGSLVCVFGDAQVEGVVAAAGEGVGEEEALVCVVPSAARAGEVPHPQTLTSNP